MSLTRGDEPVHLKDIAPEAIPRRADGLLRVTQFLRALDHAFVYAAELLGRRRVRRNNVGRIAYHVRQCDTLFLG